MSIHVNRKWQGSLEPQCKRLRKQLSMITQRSTCSHICVVFRTISGKILEPEVVVCKSQVVWVDHGPLALPSCIHNSL